MEAALVRQVWRRAHRCCEYCWMPQDCDETTFEIDHIIPRTRKLTPLFNPRRHKWSRHFGWDGPVLRGHTAIGRVTVSVLHVNDPYRVALREGLMEEGVYPPVCFV